MKAKLKVVGCGTSTGVPVPGCSCRVCTSKDLKNRRERTSCFVQLESREVILIDASPDIRYQSLCYGLHRVDLLLMTHHHADHILGFDFLRVFNFVKKGPIPVFLLPATKKEIEKIFHYIVKPDPKYKGGMLTKVEFNELSFFKPIKFNNIEIIPFPLKHGDMEVAGFKIGNTAWATDCNYIPEETYNLLKGIDILFLNALREQPSHPTHFTISESVTAVNKIKPKKAYFIHMTHNVDYYELKDKLPHYIEPAYDGLEVEIAI